MQTPELIEVVCEEKSCAWRGRECDSLKKARNIAGEHVYHTSHSVKIITIYWIGPESQ